MKIFCIGMNKTGTRSVRVALERLGYCVAPVVPALEFLDDWSRRRFGRIIEFCKKWDAFSDVPFSLAFTYQALDVAYPDSKFILTVRDNADQWYRSAMRFLASLWGTGGRLPTVEQLRMVRYGGSGHALEVMRLVYGYPHVPLWDKRTWQELYLWHNDSVIRYFAHRVTDLLVLNVARGDAWVPLCGFLGKKRPGVPFPWENRGVSG